MRTTAYNLHSLNDNFKGIHGNIILLFLIFFAFLFFPQKALSTTWKQRAVVFCWMIVLFGQLDQLNPSKYG